MYGGAPTERFQTDPVPASPLMYHERVERMSLSRERPLAHHPVATPNWCAATTNAAYPVEPGWDSEECPIGQPPYLTPQG